MIKYLLSKGFFHLLSANFLIQFLGFGTVLLVAKFLTPTEIGDIKIIQSYAAVFIVIAGFGFDTAILKLCSQKTQTVERYSILKFALKRVPISFVLSLLILFSLSFSGWLVSSQHISNWLLVYSLSIPFSVFTGILVVFLQAQKQIHEMARAQTIIKIQSFVLIVFLSFVMGFKGFIFGTIIAYIAGIVPLLRQIDHRLLSTKVGPIDGEFYHLALFSFLGNGIKIIGQYGDLFLLDHFVKDRAEIGYYALATVFFMAAMQVTGAVQVITTPYFSENHNDGKWLRKELYRNQSRLIFLSLFVSVGMYFVVLLLLKYFYGSEYASTLTYVCILLLKYIVISSVSLIGVFFLSIGFIKYNFIMVLISTPCGLLISYILLQYYGVTGVAWGQVFSAVILAVIAISFLPLGLRKTFSTSP